MQCALSLTLKLIIFIEIINFCKKFDIILIQLLLKVDMKDTPLHVTPDVLKPTVEGEIWDLNPAARTIGGAGGSGHNIWTK